ncbi:MAG: hypothetical protein OXI76_12630 [Gemmatimonadota bacterium]|nr:hypothetical protein [Gemmatimonadota bacterium]
MKQVVDKAEFTLLHEFARSFSLATEAAYQVSVGCPDADLSSSLVQYVDSRPVGGNINVDHKPEQGLTLEHIPEFVLGLSHPLFNGGERNTVVFRIAGAPADRQCD